MTQGLAKTLIVFDKAAVENYNKFSVKDEFERQINIEINTDFNPAEYSPEIGVVVSTRNKFLNVGDTVLILYDVFIRGKTKVGKETDEQTRQIEPGSEIHYVYDREIPAKIENYNTPEEKIIPLPGNVVIKAYEPEKVKAENRSIILALPLSVTQYAHELVSSDMSMEELTKEIDAVYEDAPRNPRFRSDYWAEVVAAPDDDEQIKIAKEVFCKAGMFLPFNYKNLSVIEYDDILLTKN